MYFLALSQAPPVLEKDIAIYIPEAIAPAKRPLTPLEPNKKPAAKGESSTKRPGITICLIEALVEISMQR